MVFFTPSSDANYLRGVPCDVKLVYKRSWVVEADKNADRHIVRITVNE